MFIEFSVGNYRSFKETATLSMVAAKLNAKQASVDTDNTVQVGNDFSLLTSAGVYGANASGKSNLIHAMGFMRNLVLYSSRESQADEPISVVPFRLDVTTEDAPSFFELIFLVEGVPYRYGFEVTAEKVHTEWLFFSPKGKEAKLFTREAEDISLSRSFKGGQRLMELTRPNALFLSVAAQFNNEVAKRVFAWFKSFGFISGLEDRYYRNFTVNRFDDDPSFRTGILEIIQESDVGIKNVISIKEPIRSFLPIEKLQELRTRINKDIKEDEEVIALKSIHSKQCENGAIEDVQFDFQEESEGTQKLFFMSGPVIDTLRKGGVLVVDEIEARLHTLLTRKLIGLFSSEITNPNHAQLIFATHDTNLLSKDSFRRDQIWFVEKDEDGASHLYSLAELKIRNDASFESDYLKGRYGSIPILGEIRQTLAIIRQEGNHVNE
ncbi:MAG: ATP-binding protein [Anaerolineaceae bacterium]